MFDRNGDGYISKQEFKHCMMHFGERFTNEEVEEMIAEADSNNDGKIDYHEFSKMILSEITWLLPLFPTLQEQPISGHCQKGAVIVYNVIVWMDISKL